MTKDEKYLNLTSLSEDFLKTNDVDGLKELKTKIVKEVTDCKYKPAEFEKVAYTISVWAGDLDAHINEVEQGTISAQTKNFTAKSLTGLRALAEGSDFA